MHVMALSLLTLGAHAPEGYSTYFARKPGTVLLQKGGKRREEGGKRRKRKEEEKKEEEREEEEKRGKFEYQL